MSRWRQAHVSVDASHHLIGEKPLYRQRFDEVLSFHEPGLAAVRADGRAWHIDERGEAAYSHRYARTFGFYDGLAAVCDGEPREWVYINRAGEPVGELRFAWCGNFQGGYAVVRDLKGRYFHIDGALNPLYSERWRYAGDFRHGIAVVQGDDGRSTHIDRRGALVHGRCFADLDVFHKGFARARDDSGWFHIDLAGAPLYRRRFAAIEPFYNGQARVLRDDGGLEIIDEQGFLQLEIRPAQRDLFADLSRLLVGSWSTYTIAVAVHVGIIEALPGRSEEVAGRAAIPTAKALRLLRALGELGIVERRGDCWYLTALGGPLRRDHAESLAEAALEYAGPLGDCWRKLGEALRVERWSPPDVFAEVAKAEGRIVSHHRMLASYAAHDYPALVDALPIRKSTRMIDAGGGSGTLAFAILQRHRGAQVTVLERPEVAALVRCELAPGRLQAVAGDLRQTWSIRGNLVLFSRVLHDWSDDIALVILRQARAALDPGGSVAIIEMLLEEENFRGGLCDLHVLCVTGGRERTFADYAKLLQQAGFSAIERHSVASLTQLIMAKV